MNPQSPFSAWPFAPLSELDGGWEPSRRAVRGPTRPWDDLRVLLEAPEPLPPQPLPPPSAVRGGTLTWEEGPPPSNDVGSLPPPPSSPTRLGTLEWDPGIFETWREALEAGGIARSLLPEPEQAPIVAADRFDDLGVDAALLAFAEGSTPSRRAQKPELGGFAIPWAAEAPTIEIRGSSDMDPGELSVLLGLED